MKNLINQIMKFGVVGVIAFIIDYGILYFCTEFLHIHYLISSVISFTISVIVNYILSTSWVFASKNTKDNFIIFIILSIIGLVINEIIMWMFVDKIHIYYMFSKLVATFVVMVWNFITRKLILEKNMTLEDLKNKCLSYSKLINSKWNSFISIKYINKIFLFLPHNLIILILLIISIITIVNFENSINDYVTVYSQSDTSSNIGEILKKEKIDLSFIDDSDEEVSSICFKFGTYARKNNISLRLKIVNDGKIIANSKILVRNIVDGGEGCFNVKGVKVNDIKTSEVTITPSKNVSSSNTVTIFSDEEDHISVSLNKTQDDSVGVFSKICILAFIVIFMIVNYLINTKKIKPFNYLLLMLIYILPILFLMPPLQVPDEYTHFYKPYHMSQYSLNESIYDNFNDEAVKVPKNIDCLDYSKVSVADRVDNFDDIKSCFNSSKNVVIDEEKKGSSSILGYIPQTLGIKIIDTFTNSPMLIFYFGRLFTFLVSFMIVYLAIRITPKYKYLFLIVATMMMFIQQMISYSYDSILNAISLLYIAYVLKLANSDKKLNIKNWLLIILMLLIMANIKLVYLPLAVLLLLIPKKNMHCKNNFKKIILIILSVILVYVLYKGLGYLLNIGKDTTKLVEKVTDATEVKNYTSKDQLHYLLESPINLIRVAGNTILLKGKFYLESLVGYFGWFKFKISDIYILVYLILFGYIILGENGNFNKKTRILLLLGVLASIVGCCLAMYLYWSDYRLYYVEGVQGRYFIPLLLPLALVFIPKKKKYKIDNRIIYSSINIILLQYVMTLLLWYY